MAHKKHGFTPEMGSVYAGGVTPTALPESAPHARPTSAPNTSFIPDPLHKHDMVHHMEKAIRQALVNKLSNR